MECVIPLAKGCPPVVECPECRRETVLEGGSAAAGAAALPSNYAIVGVIAAIEQDKQSKIKHPPCQGGCVDEPSSTYRCSDCDTYLCNECCWHHSRKKATSGHTTVNLKEPSIKGPPAAPGTAPPSVAQVAAEVKCATHNESLKIYCHGHKEVICMCGVSFFYLADFFSFLPFLSKLCIIFLKSF